MNTAKDKHIIGAEQYIITHRDCTIGLNLCKIYEFEPRRIEFRVIINGPIHIPMNTLVNASSDLPFVPNAQKLAAKSEMMSGPQRSHSLRILS